MAPEGLLPERLRIELARSRSLSDLLSLVLTEARRLTDAEAGAVYLRDGDGVRAALAHNDLLASRLGAAAATSALADATSAPGEVVLRVFATGETVNLRDVYRLPEESGLTFDRTRDLSLRYRSRSLLAVPFTTTSGEVLGVLELVNARAANREIGPFAAWHELVVEALARHAAASMERDPETLAPVVETPAAISAMPLASPRPVGRRLGELVMSHGLVTAAQLEGALAEQRHTRDNVGLILVRRGVITEQQLTFFLSQQFKVPAVALEDVSVEPAVLTLVPYEIAAKHELVPLQRVGDSLMIAIADPNNLAAIEDLGFLTGLEVFPSIAPRTAVRQTIERFYAQAEPGTPAAEPELDDLEIVDDGIDVQGPVDLLELRTSADETPVVRLVNSLIRDAIRRRASDIHIEPFDSTLRVRFRVDGVLRHITTRPRRLEAPIVSRIKIMANLDISERRRAQDGHLKIRYEGREVDLRVAILPTRFGEAVVIRILDRANLRADLPALGFDATSLQRFREAVASPYGLVLITGPTGSGKTTTLYGALKSLNAMETKILTIEDPVEYGLEGVNQVEVNEALGRTFSTTLRSFLRHDPDVIMLGEMRDLDTAQVAIRAGLTGHLVLSTLHTNDAPSSVTRLIDMGIPAFLVAGALRLVVAQRLVRRLCAACKEPYEIDESSLVIYGHLPEQEGTKRTVYRAKGCAQCEGRGLSGRVGLYQVMPFSDEIKQMTLMSPTDVDIAKVARQDGMQSLRELGFGKVFEGLTTVEEVLRVTAE